MHILILSSRIPYPLTAGFRIRIFNVAKYLKQDGHQVDLLCLGSKEEVKQYSNELGEVFANIYTIEQPRTERIINVLSGAFKPSLPFQVLLYKCNALKDKLFEIEKQYDVIIGNHIRTSEYLKGLNANKVVLDMHDAISYNYYNARKIARGIQRIIYAIEYKRVLKYECSIVSAFKKIVMISQKDAFWLKEHGVDISNIEIIPVAVRDDIRSIKENYEKDEMIISFLGKMSYQPNIDAVIWFSNFVLPMLEKKYPELKFYVMGIEPPESIMELGKSENIVITGFVENPYEIIKKSIASVVPIRNGAGIQNKVLESMIVGTPVVASVIAAEGIEARDGINILIADNATQYLDYISELIESLELRKKIGLEGKEFVENNYTWKNLYRRWKTLLLKEI